MAPDDASPTGSGPGPLPVLVVGAGPTGLALAAQLQAYGVKFRLIDRQLDRVHESRALAVQPRTLEVLAGLGVTDEMVRRGNPAVRLRMHVGRRTVPVRLFDIGIDDTAYPNLLFLSQAETERILVERLARGGAAVERGVELLALDAGEDAVTCTLRHQDGRQETVAARYVAGCDGAHSTVRQSAGIAFRGRAYPQTFVLADLEADGIDPSFVHAFVSPRGILLFFPLGAPATWRMITIRQETGTRPPADPATERPAEPVTLREAQGLADAYSPTAVRLHDPVWMTGFRLSCRGAARYRAGRIFLAGDAAHIHSPAGGQGMNTGIQDSINLGWKLGLVTAGHADPALLATYEAERAPVGRAVLRFTDRAFTAATSAGPIARFARARLVPYLVPVVLRARAGRAYAFRTVSQLAIRYRGSAASAEGPGTPKRGPRAGDRLPDAPITVDGRPGTLHRALATPGYHLLLCGPAQSWAAEAGQGVAERYAGILTTHRLSGDDDPGALRDAGGLALRRLGLTGAQTAHYLIRPDGHIGYRAGGTSLAGLESYLARWLDRPAR